MKEGLTYQHKDTQKLVYMGRLKIRDFDKVWGSQETQLLMVEPSQFRHVFWDLDAKKWHFERGFTKLANIANEECHAEFANLHTEFTKSKYASKSGKLVLSPISLADVVADSNNQSWFFIKVDGGYQPARLATRRPIDSHGYHRYGDRQLSAPEGQTDTEFWPVDPYLLSEVDGSNVFSKFTNRYRWHGDPRGDVSSSYIEDKELLTPEIQLQSKKKVEVYNYVKRRKNQKIPQSS